MAVAFRSFADTFDNSNTTITVGEPAGAAQNDILIAMVLISPDRTVTPPANWSNTFHGTVLTAKANLAGHEIDCYGYWIRRGASAPSLTWTFSDFTFIAAGVGAWSGALATGDPFSFADGQVRNDTASRTYPNTSGTTLDANELLVFLGQSNTTPTSGTPPTTPAFVEDRDASVGNNFEVAHYTQAGAGATGTVTGAVYGGGSTETSAAFLIGLRPVAESLTAAQELPALLQAQLEPWGKQYV